MGGCADDPFSVERGRESIRFAVAGSAFASGDTIVATLGNRSDRMLGYNLCLAILERQTPSDWQQVPRNSPEFFCPLSFNPLGPGELDSLTQPVLETFPPGAYRFRTEIAWPVEDDQRFEVTTGSFSLE
jgi:hypothetical protein